MRLLPALPAAATAALAAWAWTRWQQRWTPDFELYTQGGIGLYPSPIGRLLGNLGETGFAAVSAVAAGVSVWMVTSRSLGRGAVILLSPVLLYLTFASADVIALGLYAAWLASSRHTLFALGVFTHFALLPYALLHLALTEKMSRVQKFVAGYFLGGTAAIVLMVTPYGGIVFIDRGFWSAAGYGLALAALVSLPALVFFRPRLIHYMAFTVGALECGLQNHAQARYFLPAILLLAATGRPRNIPLLGDRKRSADVRRSLHVETASHTLHAARSLLRVERSLQRLRTPGARAQVQGVELERAGADPSRSVRVNRRARLPWRSLPLLVRGCKPATDVVESADAPRSMGRQRVGQVPAAYATSRRKP